MWGGTLVGVGDERAGSFVGRRKSNDSRNIILQLKPPIPPHPFSNPPSPPRRPPSFCPSCTLLALPLTWRRTCPQPKR